MGTPVPMVPGTHPPAQEQGILRQALTEFLMDIRGLKTDTQDHKVYQMDIKVEHPTGIQDNKMDIQVHPMDTMVHLTDT